jgi:hypothetical protein
MASESHSSVLSVSDVIGTALIDHDHTVAVHFETPESNKIAVLIPKAVASKLVDELTGTLAGTKAQIAG